MPSEWSRLRVWTLLADALGPPPSHPPLAVAAVAAVAAPSAHLQSGHIVVDDAEDERR